MLSGWLFSARGWSPLFLLEMLSMKLEAVARFDEVSSFLTNRHDKPVVITTFTKWYKPFDNNTVNLMP